MQRSKQPNYLVNILNRVKWPILLGLFCLILNIFNLSDNNTAKLLFHKISLICIAVALAHFFRLILFPYIDLSELLKNDKSTELPDAIKATGICIMIGLLMFGIIYGITAGL